MERACEHETAITLANHDSFEVLRCTWDCGMIYIRIGQRTYTPVEIDVQAERIAELETILGELVSILKYGEQYGVRLLYSDGAKFRDKVIDRATTLMNN